MSEVPNVYAGIAAVSEEISKTGISKSRKNATQGYNFRGIDDVYNELAPILAKHRLVIVPRFLSRECTERQSKGGGALYAVIVEAEFDFVSAIDGSKHTARTYGEAMDSADKATNKAMSAAYKYAAFQTFCIPTEGDNDADSTTPEVDPGPAYPPPHHPPLPDMPQPPPSRPQQRSQSNGHGSDLLISEAQAKRLYAIAKKSGWEDQVLRDWLHDQYGYPSSKLIKRSDYEAICKALEGRG